MDETVKKIFNIILLLNTLYLLPCYDIDNPINLQEFDKRINELTEKLNEKDRIPIINNQSNSELKDIYATLSVLYASKQDWGNTEKMLIQSFPGNPFYYPDQVGNKLAYIALFYFHYSKNSDFKLAKKYLKKIKKEDKNHRATLTNLGFVNHALGQYDAALKYFNKVLQQNPENKTTLFAKSQTDLMLGTWEDGFKHFELRRIVCPVDGGEKFIQKPAWDGKESLEHKTILVVGEEWYGFGDFFQFIRYTKLLKDQGAYVIVVVRNPLKMIMQSCPFVDQIVAVKDNVPAHDFYVPYMSLPYFFNTTPDTIPFSNEAYLDIKGNLPTELEEKINKDQNVKIGLCYEGKTQYVTPFGFPYPSGRSILLQMLLNSLKIPGVSFYLLNPVDEQVTQEIRDHIIISEKDFDKNGAFTDIARLMKKLDVSVCVDTSIPNLGGACGAKIFLLLQKYADWRWMLQTEEKTLWYPDVTIFRQREQGDWSHPLELIKEKILKMIKNKNKKIY